jgi:hypothetical protein
VSDFQGSTHSKVDDFEELVFAEAAWSLAGGRGNAPVCFLIGIPSYAHSTNGQASAADV